MSKKPADYVFTLPSGLQPPYKVGWQVFFALVGHWPIRQQISDFGLIRLANEPCDERDGLKACLQPLRPGGSQWVIIMPSVMEGTISDVRYTIRDGAVLLCHIEVQSGGRFYTLATGDIIAATPDRVQFALTAYLHASACVALARKTYDSTPEMAQVNHMDWLALNRLQKMTQLELKRINANKQADTLPIKTAFVVTPMTKKNRIKEVDAVYSTTRNSHYTLDLRRSPLKLRGAGGPWVFTWPNADQDENDRLTISRVLYHLSEILFANVGLPSRGSLDPGLLFSGPYTFTFGPNTMPGAIPFGLTFMVRQTGDGQSVYIRTPLISHDPAVYVERITHGVVYADYTTVNTINAACGTFVAQNAITRPDEMFHVSRHSIFLAAVQALRDIEAAEDAGNNLFMSEADRRRLGQLLAAVKRVPQYRKWMKTNE